MGNLPFPIPGQHDPNAETLLEHMFKSNVDDKYKLEIIDRWVELAKQDIKPSNTKKIFMRAISKFTFNSKPYLEFEELFFGCYLSGLRNVYAINKSETSLSRDQLTRLKDRGLIIYNKKYVALHPTNCILPMPRAKCVYELSRPFSTKYH